MNEQQIRDFWQAHPCGEDQIDSLLGDMARDQDQFFTGYDNYRYSIGKEGHILQCLDAIDLNGKRVLEIGLGQGAESEQLIRRGAIWSGVDLTAESIHRVRARLKLRDLPYERLEQGSALALPFENESFDMVFSHGVLHHIPDIGTAQSEISRVLKPNGELIAMLYAKNSFEYFVRIGILSRAALLLRYLTRRGGTGDAAQHLLDAREEGLYHYLRMENFIHRNTDGARNPYSKTYRLRDVKKDFARFRVIQHYRRYMSPVPRYRSRLWSWLRIDRMLGWHLWVHMAKQ